MNKNLYFWSVFSHIRTRYGKYGPEELRIRRLCTQRRGKLFYKSLKNSLTCSHYYNFVPQYFDPFGKICKLRKYVFREVTIMLFMAAPTFTNTSRVSRKNQYIFHHIQVNLDYNTFHYMVLYDFKFFFTRLVLLIIYFSVKFRL